MVRLDLYIGKNPNNGAVPDFQFYDAPADASTPSGDVISWLEHRPGTPEVLLGQAVTGDPVVIDRRAVPYITYRRVPL